MIRDIQAKVLLSHVKQPDTWFGLKYNMNLYRGCQHQCIYCDSRSECYQIENFKDILVKANAIELLRDELSRKRVKGTIGFGSMNDPYMPLEMKRNMAGQALEVIAQFRFPIHIITKSDLVLRDIELLREISKVYAAITFTITTADDELGKKVEPGAPLVSARYAAMETLAANGILTGVTLMPVLPFLEDNPENITEIITRAHNAGASYILPSFGMSLRDRQRAYYYREIEKLYPGLSKEYHRVFGNQYHCQVENADELYGLFNELCVDYNLATRIPMYKPDMGTQLSLI